MSKYYETKGTAQAFHIHMAVLTFTFSEEKFWLSFGKLTNTHRLIYFMCHYGKHVTPLNLILGVSLLSWNKLSYNMFHVKISAMFESDIT